MFFRMDQRTSYLGWMWKITDLLFTQSSSFSLPRCSALCVSVLEILTLSDPQES